jgi:hypothetical protein
MPHVPPEAQERKLHQLPLSKKGPHGRRRDFRSWPTAEAFELAKYSRFLGFNGHSMRLGCLRLSVVRARHRVDSVPPEPRFGADDLVISWAGNEP